MCDYSVRFSTSIFYSSSNDTKDYNKNKNSRFRKKLYIRNDDSFAKTMTLNFLCYANSYSVYEMRGKIKKIKKALTMRKVKKMKIFF